MTQWPVGARSARAVVTRLAGGQSPRHGGSPGPGWTTGVPWYGPTSAGNRDERSNSLRSAWSARPGSRWASKRPGAPACSARTAGTGYSSPTRSGSAKQPAAAMTSRRRPSCADQMRRRDGKPRRRRWQAQQGTSTQARPTPIRLVQIRELCARSTRASSIAVTRSYSAGRARIAIR